VYVRTKSIYDPAVEFTATSDGNTAVMGGSIRAGQVTLRATVIGGKNQELVWIKRGEPIELVRLASDHAGLSHVTEAAAGDWYSLVVRTNQRPTVLSNAIYVDP
jgi:hypothetical protein